MIAYRVGNGYDVHRLERGLRLVLCGVEIPHSSGCVAHSDGDVAIHSLCDAILGSVAMGDIGVHFPDTSSDFKNIDSTILLKKTMELLRSKRYQLSNADITIVAQRPKLRPYIESMRERLAEVMGVDCDQISVKATTSEQLGFEGREEGISAYATVMVSSNNG